VLLADSEGLVSLMETGPFEFWDLLTLRSVLDALGAVVSRMCPTLAKGSRISPGCLFDDVDNVNVIARDPDVPLCVLHDSAIPTVHFLGDEMTRLAINEEDVNVRSEHRVLLVRVVTSL